MADKGWYPDPTGPAGQQRYWDGWAWTPQTTPAPASRSGSTMMLVVGAALGAFLLVCGLLGAVVLAVGDEEPDRATSADATQSDETDEDDPTDEETDDATSDDATDDEPQAEPVTEEAKPKKRKARTYLVINVVDGDTVDLDSGETVRLAGIDTPERGTCGHERAADALARFVLGKRVTLVASDEDRDQYDRLLRYIDVGKADAGLRLIKRGLAIARYDSRDGYGRHPREDRYVAADEGSPDVKCQPKPKPQPQPFVDPGQGSDCEAGYDPCVPHYPPDLDCADVGPVTVTGNDPHGLDGDGDGRACGGD